MIALADRVYPWLREVSDEEFDYLRLWGAAFAERGFAVKAWEHQPFLEISGKGVCGIFTHPGYRYGPRAAGALLADNASVFDKWWKCPCRIKLARHPHSQSWDRTLTALAFLASNPDLAARAFGVNAHFLWED